MTMMMPRIHVGRGEKLGPLTVFPLWTDGEPPGGLATGESASVQVSELVAGPTVSALHLTNGGDRMALLLDGELLEGGWQHRVLRHDLVMVPGRHLDVPVACVEEHRWNGGPAFQRRARRASPSIRLALSGAPNQLQGRVWQRVNRYNQAFGDVQNSSYAEHLNRFATGNQAAFGGQSKSAPRQVAGWIEEFRGARPLPGQRGLLVGAAGQPALLELFPSRGALASHLDALLIGFLLDVITNGVPLEVTPSRRARRFVERIEVVPATGDPAAVAGVAIAHRANTPYTVVRGVSLGSRWAHLTIFNQRHPVLAIS